MNVELLRKIAVAIQENPAEFDMQLFAHHKSWSTTYCIGGWALRLSGLNPDMDSEEDAARLLDIDMRQANRLFYANTRDEWKKYGGWEATAHQAAARIEHFIATDGRE